MACSVDNPAVRVLFARFLPEVVVRHAGVVPEQLALLADPERKPGDPGNNEEPAVQADPLVEDGHAAAPVELQFLPRGLEPQSWATAWSVSSVPCVLS